MTPPIIALDIRKSADYGIGTYIHQVLGLLDEPCGFRFRLYANRDEWWPRYGSRPDVELVREEAGHYSLRELLSIGSDLRRRPCALFHAPHYVVPLWKGPTPQVVTIHDLIHLLFPEMHPHRGYGAYAAWMIGRAVRTSRKIICPSEATRMSLLQRYPQAEGKIVVIPHGVEPHFQPTLEQAPGKPPAILYVGSLAYHKNFVTLLRAWDRLVRRGWPDLELWCAGRTPEGHSALGKTMQGLVAPDRLKFLGFIESQDLPSLYHRATILAFPSLYEGFGLPALEAMASGLPVVASTGGSLPEVVGDAAPLCDPRDPEAFASAMERLLQSPEEWAVRQHKGIERAATFSLARTRKAHLDLYREVIGGG